MRFVGETIKMFTLSTEELMALSSLKVCILSVPVGQINPIQEGLALLSRSHTPEFCSTAEKAVVKILEIMV